MTTLPPKANYRFNAIPIKNPMLLSPEIEKSTLKFIWKTMNSQSNPEQKSNAGSITILVFKLY
jgi:hypothetical protein